jgi:hypothetical protein
MNRALGESPPSALACTTPVAAPTDLVATLVNGHHVELTWTDNSGIEVSYDVRRWFPGELYPYHRSGTGLMMITVLLLS